VIVIALLAVSTVAPPGARSFIVTVAVAALSARICHDTACDPPAATVGSAWVADCGLSSRIESVGVSLFTTYVLPFEITGLLMLTAVIGAVVLARKKIA